MDRLVLYYSRTGTTAAVAKVLAGKLGADIAEIACPRYRLGWFRYLRAGYDSIKGNLPPVEIPPISFARYRMVVLGAPIWTSYPALPLRAFLSQHKDLGQYGDLAGRVALFLTYGGHSPPQKAIEFVADLLPTKLHATLAVQQEDVDRGEVSKMIGAFVDDLAAKA